MKDFADAEVKFTSLLKEGKEELVIPQVPSSSDPLSPGGNRSVECEADEVCIINQAGSNLRGDASRNKGLDQ